MKGFVALCGLAGAVLVVPASPTLAQSGVLSGPPQVGIERGAGLTRGQSGVLSGPPQVRIERGAGAGPSAGQGAGVRPQGGTWIAVVGGFDGNGRKVSVGYSGYQRSQLEAEDAAVKACRGNAPAVQCRTPFAVSSGCIYIVPGNRPGGGVTWGRGHTRQAAFSECRRGGYTCPGSKMVGGCVPGYN